MKPNIIHSIVVCLLAFALPLMVGCSSQEASLPGTTEAALYLNVATIGPTRSGLGELSGNERMKSLRVIILHEDGTVEHNRYFLLEGPQEEKYILLKVTPNEKKTIYLFANEESVASVEGVTVTGESQTLTAFFNSYTEGKGGFAGEVNELYFAPDYSDGNPIPMSSVYEIDFPEKGNVSKVFYVVRVATKFTVNFENWRDEDVTVNSFTIASHADRNFLMAHVNSYPHSETYALWIDWLKKVSDASSKDDSYATTEAAGWLKDYELPTQASTTEIYTHGSMTVPESVNSIPGNANTVFYLPESKSLKDGATDGEQEYTMTINIDGRDEPFVCKLPNLKALFRNTHVVMNIAMSNKYTELNLDVDIVPWGNRELFLDYTETVSSDGSITWQEDTYDNYDNANGTIVLKPWGEFYDDNDDNDDKEWIPLIGSFKLLTPIAATWTASLLTTAGDPVFRFLTPQGEAVPNISGTINGQISDISIISLESQPQRTNSAKLQIIVTLPNGTVLRVPSGFDKYTIVQNPL